MDYFLEPPKHKYGQADISETSVALLNYKTLK